MEAKRSAMTKKEAVFSKFLQIASKEAKQPSSYNLPYRLNRQNQARWLHSALVEALAFAETLAGLGTVTAALSVWCHYCIFIAANPGLLDVPFLTMIGHLSSDSDDFPLS